MNYCIWISTPFSACGKLILLMPKSRFFNLILYYVAFSRLVSIVTAAAETTTETGDTVITTTTGEVTETTITGK